MPVTVDLDKCVGSRDCLNACAFNAIEVQNGKAVIFENCVDCDACVRACPTHAINSSTAPASTSGGVLIVDFAERSGIAAAIERAVKRAGTTSIGMRVDSSDAGAAADALAAYLIESGSSLVVLPHSGAGDAIASRVAAKLGAALLAGCSDLSLDDSGGVRAVRTPYGGIARTTSRVGAGTTIATLVPRGPAPFSSQQLEAGSTTRLGDAPPYPTRLARAVVVIGSTLSEDAQTAASACAGALGATVIEADDLASANISPELLVAVGVEGSTEQNAALRRSGIVVALVHDVAAPIVQAADFILVGDVAENAKALLAAL